MAVRIFFYLFFLQTFDFRAITMYKNIPKNNGFLLTKKPGAVALIGGKDMFLFQVT